MLPFLKNKHEGGVSMPVEVIEREPDEDKPYGMLDAIVEDLMDGVHKKDKKMLKSALEALVEHIQEKDEKQDHELTHKDLT